MMHRQQLPQSPSWISIRKNNRSTSLPRIRLDRRDSPSYFEDSSSSRETAGVTVGRVGVRSWAKTFLSGAASAVTKSSTTLSPPTNPLPFRKTASSISRRRRTPVLTLALLKLDEQLTTYCERLKDPSSSNVEAACDLLSRTIATASPTTTSSGSPATPSLPLVARRFCPCLFQSLFCTCEHVGCSMGTSSTPSVVSYMFSYGRLSWWSGGTMACASGQISHFLAVVFESSCSVFQHITLLNTCNCVHGFEQICEK